MSASEKKKEDWMNAKWRPMMGWIYMITCITDFILFPVLWSALQAAMKMPVTPWNPITLQGAGLFHLSMGAIIGIAAFGRTQEKLAGANNGGAASTTGFGVPSPGPSSFQAPTSAGFGAASSPSNVSGGGFGGVSSFSSPPAARGPVTQPAFTPAGQTVTSSTGKPMPVQPEQPEL